MDLSKLIICRQDVIVVSDTESQPNKLCSNKKKKLKQKIECIRKVQLTTVTVNRPIPNCYRPECRNGEYFHRKTAHNTKYRKRSAAPPDNKYKKTEAPTKKIMFEAHENDDTSNVIHRDLHSPITVDSSSDMFENISSNSFDSDSAVFEELIKSTRERMKSGNDSLPPINKDGYQNISSNEESMGGSLHSMDTVILEGIKSFSSPKSAERFNAVSPSGLDDNNELVPMLLCNTPDNVGDEFIDQNLNSPRPDSNDNLSPVYEIYGKVFMEHYLNTSII